MIQAGSDIRFSSCSLAIPHSKRQQAAAAVTMPTESLGHRPNFDFTHLEFLLFLLTGRPLRGQPLHEDGKTVDFLWLCVKRGHEPVDGLSLLISVTLPRD
jgi:hypothetical protein